MYQHLFKLENLFHGPFQVESFEIAATRSRDSRIFLYILMQIAVLQFLKMQFFSFFWRLERPAVLGVWWGQFHYKCSLVFRHMRN